MSYMADLKNISPGLPPPPNELFLFSWQSPIGLIHVAGTSLGLCRIILGRLRKQDVVSFFKKSYGVQPLQREVPWGSIEDELDGYLTGSRTVFSSPIQLIRTTSFDQKVWKVLTQIPYGETRSYHWVAQKIRQPNAARAVGRACGRNPLPIIIPCHRVIAKSGELGGYTGGIHFKKRLLNLEKTYARPR
jgi:methylated-DNA-[protein]-cysteine S-methyltransferase